MTTYRITLTETTEYSVTVNDEQMAQILAQAGINHTPGEAPIGLEVESALHNYDAGDEYTPEWLTDNGAERILTEYSVETLPTTATT